MKPLARETRLVLRDRTSLVVVCLGLCAIAVAAMVPFRSTQVRLAAREQAEGEARQKLVVTVDAVAKSEKSFHPPMDYEMPGVLETREKLYNFEAVLPPSPMAAATLPSPANRLETLSVYDHNDEHPSLLTGHGRLLSNVSEKPSPVNPLAAFIGNFDLLFVVCVVLPLLVIGLASDLIASDGQSGTLRLLLSQGVSTWRLLVLRLGARMVVSFVPWLFVMAGMIALVAHRDGSAVPWLRIGWWTAVAALYLALWFLLCLLANAWFRAPLRTALSLLAGWTAFVLLIPMAVGLSLRVWRPVVPTLLLSDTEKAKREAVNETMNAAYLATMEAFHGDTGIDPLKLKPEQRPRYLQLLRTTPFPLPHGNAVLDCYFRSYPASENRFMHYQQYYAAQIGRDCLMTERFSEDMDSAAAAALAQERSAARLQWLSPMLAARAALANIAGADDERSKLFLDQFDSYLRRREAFFGRHMRAYTPIYSAELSRYALFRFEEPALAVGRALRFVYVLLGFDLALLWAGWRTALHRKGATE